VVPTHCFTAGVAYYRKTQQRVRIVFDAAVIAETESTGRDASEREPRECTEITESL
jgi:hypothetical protein